jgi:T1SS-143 domain-containing protein
MPKDISNVVETTNANKVFDLPIHLQPGQINTLTFTQDSIAEMRLLAKGELEILFRDGSKVVVENFDELANSAQSCGRDTLIQLSDNTIIYPDELRAQLTEAPVVFAGRDVDTGVVALDAPKPGQISEQMIEAGREYKFGFGLTDTVSAAQAGENLILTFKDGGVLVLKNYFVAVGTELPPVMTLADGAAVDASALLTSCRLAEIPTVAEVVAGNVPQVEIREAAPQIEPAAGAEEQPVPAKQEMAAVEPAAGEEVANIEPAAGDAGARPGSASRGYGFGSAIEPAPFGNQDPIGPIAPTALRYGIPEADAQILGGPQTATILPPDTIPTLSGAAVVEDETVIGSVSGSVTADFKANGPGTVSPTGVSTFAANGSLAGGVLTSCGTPVTVALVGDTYVGSAAGAAVFTLKVNTDGTFTFTQILPLDHADTANPDDAILLDFGVTATDNDGDAATATIVVTVKDDGPVAVDDGASVGSSPLTVSGNVLTNDDDGTDGDGKVTEVVFSGATTLVPAVGTVSVVGAYGTLVIAADGSYTYTSSNTATGTDMFRYTMVDCDGDPSSANLAVAVTDIDTIPVVSPASGTVDETFLTPVSVSGTVVADFKADAPGALALNDTFTSGGSKLGGALTSAGVSVVVSHVGNTYTGTAGGETVFTLTLNAATGAYTYTQFKALDHADGSNPNDVITLTFGVTATDSDTDSATASITINVKDDGPIAVNDAFSISPGNTSVSGNVTANDIVGHDVPGYVVKEVSFGGTTYAVPTSGTVSVVGTYGTLVIGKDGAFTYTSKNTAEGTDTFVYKIYDRDGDKGTANLSLTVKDIDTIPTVVVVPQSVDETTVDESGVQVVNGTIVVDYKDDAPGTLAPSGASSFLATGSLLGGSLTSNGVPVVVTLVGNTYTGTAGSAVVFTLTVNPVAGTYVYEQHGQLDHADGSNPDDVISLNFGVTATDSDGDSANGTITINVKDDAPVAENDVISAPDATLAVTGNVVTNDKIGNDKPGYVVTKVEFGGVTVNVPTSGTVTVSGAHGTLTIGKDGAFTYQPSNTSTGSDVFTYTIRDQDGDTDTATLSVRVDDIDTIPCVANSYKTVDETLLDDAGTQTVTGALSVDYRADGPGTTAPVAGSFAAGGSLAGGALTSNGVPVVVTLSGDTYTGKAGGVTVFTLKVGTNGTYEFKLYDQLDHADKTNPDDVINLDFGFKATDTDGDSANGTITIHVKDDGPVAVADVATLSSAPGSVSGNVTANDDVGADEPGYVVTKVTFGSTTVTVPASGTVVVAGAHGTLAIDHTGAYTYQGASVGSDAFTYTIVDQDGDPASAVLTVTVSDLDTVPCVTNSEKTVDETLLDDAGTQTVTGALSVDYRADGPGTTAPVAGSFAAGGSLAGGALTSNGVPVVVTLSGDTYTGKAGGVTVFTLKVGTNGTYEFKLYDQLDHADKTNPDDVINLDFGFKATDTDGDSANGTITIHVKDDGPVAVADVATLSSAPGSVSGNVTANDDVGADEPGYVVTKVTFGSTTVTVPASGTVVVAGAHGTLAIDHTGAYTYQGASVGSDAFTYTIVDQDGDPASAVLTVTVSDLDTVPCVTNSEKTVDETLLDDAGTQTVTGALSVDYRADGPGTTAPVAGSFAAGGSLAGGALTSNGVPVVVTLSGDTYTGKAGGVTVFTLKVGTNGTYEFKLYDQLDHADKTNPDDVINLDFGFKATDTDGDSANGTITIHVKDDGPVAVADVATLSSAPGSVSGNVTANDDVGADEPGYVVTKVTFGSTTVTVPASGTVVVAGAHGTLAIDHTGAYTYQGASVGSDAFTYTIVDQDGDPASAVLTVTVSDLDTVPCVTNSEKTVDETLLDDAGTQTVTGALSVDYRADGPGTTAPVAGSFAAGGSLAGGALTSNGVPVVVTLSGDTYTGKAGGVTVFTLKVGTNGTYEFKLYDQLDHADKTNPDDVINLDFGFKATDTDGDSANGTITIHVKDDGPVAVADVATLSSAPGSVSGNVTANDDVGADEPGYVVTKVTFGSTTVTVPASGTVVVAGAHGTLAIDHTGAYTYQGASVGSDAFTYTIVDQDGDPASAVLTVTVSDLDTVPCVTNSEKTVDETLLDDAGTQTVTGALSVDYRADGPGTTAPVAGSFAAGGSLAGGALTSNGVPVVVTLSGRHVYREGWGRDGIYAESWDERDVRVQAV